MAGHSSRGDQLWYFAQQLVEEEAKSIVLPQQEEHGQKIQAKYDQLVSNLSCLGDIIAKMYQKKKLTQKEFEQIRQLQSTPIRANEELLSIIARKPRDVYECFLSIIQDTNQLHLHQILDSDDISRDNADKEDLACHGDLIQQHFVWLSDRLDPENGLISLLYQKSVLTAREKEQICGVNNILQKSEALLQLIGRKSTKDFEIFLEVLEASNQGHLITKLRDTGVHYEKSMELATTTELRSEAPTEPFDDGNLASDGQLMFVTGSSADTLKAPSEVSTPKTVCRKMTPTEIQYERSMELATTTELRSEAPTEPFDDGNLAPDGQLIFVTGMKFYTRRWVAHNGYITVVGGIEVFYNIGKSVLHGTAGYGLEDEGGEFHLERGERIISVCAGSGGMVDQLQFTTNRGNVHGPFGGNGGDIHVLMMSDQSNTSAYLAYITGTVDVTQKRTAVRRLCFVWGFYKHSS